ncbi:DinB superfamily protein [Luteitalea pratensis]|uniref:DinB superfamily protein n=1 Tax=Luteitalea pratensis TaxID=1855912 RepID=A0A143PEB2_LUTPR|nr:DinB family protein [Luteitalea pratensis]AMY06855.1 DinB superfamily protein [Luteitalea pratensis]
MPNELPEVWLRGPVEGYPAELQPVVHALLQVREEVARHAADLTVEQLWARPGNAGSIGFHLRHIAGATDRLLTYARDESLAPEQLAWLKAEGVPGDPPATAAEAIDVAQQGIDRALAQVRETDVRTLLDARGVGRARLPTTVIGLVFHAAEHAGRHAGQIATMRKVVKGGA